MCIERIVRPERPGTGTKLDAVSGVERSAGIARVVSFEWSFGVCQVPPGRQGMQTVD